MATKILINLYTLSISLIYCHFGVNKILLLFINILYQCIVHHNQLINYHSVVVGLYFLIDTFVSFII